MKLDINTGSDDKIIAFEGDNLLKNESIILIQDDNIVDLTGLTCDIAYVDTKSLSGDIIENLKISSPTEGKIELPINSNLTKKDGIYDCELRLKSSSNGYVKFTAFFSLIIKANVFNRIGNKILSNDSFTKIQEILNKADGYNKDIEDKLNTIKSLDNSNIEAENNINILTVNIKNASAINDNLVKNTATAEEKNTTLNNSLEESKKYINGLNGSQNIPQIRIDLDILQNGLKSNQELEYEGTNLKCENTLDGRIEDIVLEGMTYQNLVKSGNVKKNILVGGGTEAKYNYNIPLKQNTEYTLIFNVENKANSNIRISLNSGNNGVDEITRNGIIKLKINTLNHSGLNSIWFYYPTSEANPTGSINNVILLEGDYTQPNSYIPPYFEGIKSVGEKENKINILSNGKNLFKSSLDDFINGILDGDAMRIYYKLKPNTQYICISNIPKTNPAMIYFNGGRTDMSGVWNGKSATTTTDSNGKLYISLRNTNYPVGYSIEDFFNDKYYIQLEEGTQGTSYEPYKTDKKELKLPFEGGLKGIPNGAKDLIYNKDDGCYVRKNIEKQILNGTENITLDNFIVEKENQITFSIEIPSMLSSTNKMLNLFCDKFEVTREPISNSNLEGISKYQNCIRIHIFKNKLETQDVEGFKKWLQTNPVEIYYELATPIETKISDTKLSLDTYNALTYVFSNNAISPNIKLKVASNLGSIIQQNSKSINDIYKLIDEVLIPQITTNTADIAILKLK